MRLLALLILALVAVTGATADADGEPERCGSADLATLCTAQRASLTASPNPLDGPQIHANTTYEIAGFTGGKRSYVVYEAQVTGEYTLYTGGAAAAATIRDEVATCAFEPTTSCVRRATTYVLVAGQRYQLELGPIPAGSTMLLHLEAPEEEVFVAGLGAQRLIDAGWGAGPGFAAVRRCEPSTYSTAS